MTGDGPDYVTLRAVIREAIGEVQNFTLHDGLPDVLTNRVMYALRPYINEYRLQIGRLQSDIDLVEDQRDDLLRTLEEWRRPDVSR